MSIKRQLFSLKDRPQLPSLFPPVESMSSHAAAPSSTASSSSSGGGHGSAGGGSTPSHLNSPYRAYQLWQRATYPKQVWIFVGSGLGLLVLCNIIYLLRVRSRKNALMRKSTAGPRGDPEKNATSSTTSSWNRFFGAADAAFKITAFRWTIPYGRNYVLSLSEVFFTVGYLAALLIWSFVHSHGAQAGFWAQRTGAIAYPQFMLLPLLAGKNNLITLVTGLSYEKINIMHRAVARTLFILILLHTFQKVETFTPPKLAAEKYLTGTMATVAFGAIFLTSLRPVRTHAFEFFLIMHICLVAIFLSGIYFHQPKDAIYVWLFIAFWLFDRVSRGLRMIFINRGSPTSTEAIVENVSRDSIKLVLPNRHITWKAGQHVFLILPGVSTIPVEAHPFTIANIPDRDQNGRARPTDLVFYIRAMDGFTRKLHDYAAINHAKSVVALVDGPYGAPPPVNTFNTVILIAGGSGVSFTLPLLLDIISAARRQATPVKRIVFVWTVKTYEDLRWASEAIATATHNAPSTLNLDLRIHVSRANPLVPSLSMSGLKKDVSGSGPLSPISPTEKSPIEKDTGSPIKGSSRAEIITTLAEDASTHEGHLAAATSHLKTLVGRPDISSIIQEEIQASTGPVSVNACGPARLTKAVRASLTSGAAGPSAMLHGGVPVSMYIENFGAVRSSS